MNRGVLPKPSFVQTDNIHTVPKQKFIRCLGILDDETMNEISKKIIFALGLEG